MVRPIRENGNVREEEEEEGSKIRWLMKKLWLLLSFLGTKSSNYENDILIDI